MMKKTMKIFMLFILTMYIGLDMAYAVEVGLDYSKIIYEPGNSGPTEDKPIVEPMGETTKENSTWYGKKVTKTTESCEYKTITTTNVTTYIDVYDKNFKSGKESLIPTSFVFENNHRLTAGTAIGIKIIDLRTVIWKIRPRDIKYKKETQVIEYHDSVYHPTEYQYKCYYIKNPEFQEFEQMSNSKFESELSTLSQEHSRNDINKTQTKQLAIDAKCRLPIYRDTEQECQDLATSTCLYDYSERVVKKDAYTEPAYTVKNDPKYEENKDAKKTKECREIAVKKTVGIDTNDGYSANGKLTWEAAYTIDFTNSNDANSTEKVTIYAAEASNKNNWKCYTKDNLQVPQGTKCEFQWQMGETNYINDVVQQISANYQKSLNDETFALWDLMYVKRPYKKEKTCIDKKTGYVSYVPGLDQNGRKKTACDSQNEFTIEQSVDSNGEEYWYYFIPLNAKSDHGVEINTMMDWEGTISEDLCKKYLEKYAFNGSKDLKYTDIVVIYEKSNNTTREFKGDFNGSNKDKTSYDWTILDDMKDSDNTEDKACRLTTKVKIPIKQIFYNEVTEYDENSKKDIVKLNGFNFYYKPIDVSSATKDNQVDIVFPNGVSKNILTGELKTVTLWDDWYKNQTQKGVPDKAKTPDLSESFAAATYLASAINAKEIREYNKDNAYTNWSKMNYDGTSKYISNDDIIKRLTGATDNIYPLGCGPLNVNEYLQDEHGNTLYDANRNPIKNIWYIKGCDKP